jgi:autotransporter-associated beta strand protein
VKLKSSAWIILVGVFFGLSVARAQQAPDLTNTNLALIDTSLNYNLGPTGMRGWIYVDRSSFGNNVSRGVDESMTDARPYQVLVTAIGTNTPASNVFQINDVLLGVNTGFNNVPVPLFTNDTRRAIGLAIGAAEAGDGWMNFKVWRSGVNTNLSIRLQITNMAYSATAPYNCPKSALVLSNAVNVLAGKPLNYGNVGNSLVGLAMLASGRTNLFPTLQTCARSFVADPQGHAFWDWGYKGIFLSEYYLKTGDTNVLPVIHGILLNIANNTDRYGTACHGPGFLNLDGSYNGTAGGYGPVNNCALASTIAMVLGRKCLLNAGRSIDPAIPAAITRGSNFFGWHLQKGEIQYGEHLPWGAGSHASNGKHGQATILFSMLGDRPVDTEYWTRMTLAGYVGREYGHTGQGMSYIWEALGANVAGTNAMASYIANVRWHLDLERRCDGSFVYDGAEQYGPSQVSDYWVRGGSWGNTYADEDPTAYYVLTYAVPLQQIQITGRGANPTNFLNATTVSNALWSALIPTNSVMMTTNQLMAALGEYDPNVRCWSALELGKRPGVSVSSITNLIGSTNAWLRASACVVLGQMQNTNGFPSLVQCLSDPDVSVRAHAAIALKKCGSAISGYIPAMLTAYINNATDPNVINWNDPWQGANETLGEVLFGGWILTSGVGNDNLVPHTANASRSLLYPALKIALKHPDSLSRGAAASFIKNWLTLADIQALALDLVQCATSPVLADPMWRAEGRANSIQALAKYNCAETVPVALAMVNPPWVALGQGDGPESESPNAALNAIAGFGDAVRYVLPTFNTYRADWGAFDGRFSTLASAINTISAAVTCPVITNVFPVAHSKVVITTNAIAITLTGSSCRTNAVSFQNVTAPAHGSLTGTAPSLTYTPTPGYTGLDRFTFRVADSMTNSDPATVSIFVGTPAGAGVQGQYYDTADFTSNKFTRTDSQINFDWGTGSPSNSIASDTFSARWSGALLVPESGNYMFSTMASDGARVYINGVNVLDNWVTQDRHWTDGSSIYLTAGQKYEVRMDYFEASGNAAAKLKWTGPSFAGLNGSIIASQWLYTTNALTNLPLYAYSQQLTMVKNTNQVVVLAGSPAATNFWIVTGPAHGALSGTPPVMTYTPTANYSGVDGFIFQASDGARTSSVATITVNILESLPTIFDWSNAVDGNWSVGANWTNTVAPDATGQPFYTLNFGKSGTYTVNNDLNVGFKANQINFAGNVTVAGNAICTTNNGASLPQINQNSGNGISLNAPLQLGATTTLGGIGGGQVTINGQITGLGGLIVDIPGNLRVENTNNTYSGGTLINDGTLIMSYQADRALGAGPIILNRATLYLERINATNDLAVNGGKLWAEGGWGGSWGGPVTLNGDLTLFCPGYDRFLINGGISGVGGVIVEGDGYRLPNSGNGIVFSGTNTYSGATRINAYGRLACSSSAALGNGVLSIDSGSILELNYAGTRTIGWLTLGGVDKPAGVYGSPSSSAANKDAHFAGNGTVTVVPAIGAITNQAATSVSTNGATLNAVLIGNGAPYTVVAYWNKSNGGTNALAWTNSAVVGSWTIQNSTNISCSVTGLLSNTQYFFTFCATNPIQRIWATNVLSFVTARAGANAFLDYLLPDAGSLVPAFNAATTNYTDTVNYSISSIAITPYASDINATIKVNGTVVASGMASGPISLSVGTTNIKTVVVSQDLSVTNTYVVAVTRSPASTNADLSDLVPSVGALSPAFASNTLSYAISVPYATSNMTVTPTAAEPFATITVNGSGVVSGASSGSIALNVGNTIITTVVTAQNGSTTKTYTVTVTRSPATLTVTPNASQSKTFGAVDPGLSFNYSGSFASQPPGFSGALSRMGGEAVGTYEITQGSLALVDNGDFKASDYVLSFTTGVNFTITTKNASTLTIGDISPYTYDGSPKTPQPEVKDVEIILTNGVDYTLSYSNNINAGTATVKVTGAGNYSGIQNKSFTISKTAPTVTNWPTASNISIGQAVSNATLSGGSASVPGSFGYVSPTNKPPAGVYAAAVAFLPSDSVNYLSITGSVQVTVVDVYVVPFLEPFEARTLGDLNGQFGWISDGTIVQSTNTFASSAKAAQIAGDNGYLRHAFTNERTRVWVDMRLKVVQSPEKPRPDTNCTAGVYVSTNSMVMAFNGTNVVSTGIAAVQGEWIRLTFFNDYAAKTYILFVNDVRVGKYGFFNAGVPIFSEVKVGGRSTFIDDVGVTPNQPAMKYMPSLILLQ